MATEHFDVLIIGAGLSGIGAAHHLQTNCPGHTYAILEGREAIGGTWDLFRYPGVRSDSDMYTLGYSFRRWEQLSTGFSSGLSRMRRGAPVAVSIAAFDGCMSIDGGTTCEDPPGWRDGSVGKLYLACLRDPDNNKICALHRPAK